MKPIAIPAVACAVIAVALGTSPAVAGSPTNQRCENVRTGMVCQADPPGMNFDAALGQTCRGVNPFYIFGRGRGGELVCRYDGLRFGQTGEGVWSPRTQMLFGVQQAGFGCPSWVPGGAAAETGDGRGLRCEGDTWVVWS